MTERLRQPLSPQRRPAGGTSAGLLPGTLDLLILKAASVGTTSRVRDPPAHRANLWRGVRGIEQGALYPALARLEGQHLLDAEWGVSDNNRRAKFYELTAAGRRRLRKETDGWERLVRAMTAVLRTSVRRRAEMERYAKTDVAGRRVLQGGGSDCLIGDVESSSACRSAAAA